MWDKLSKKQGYERMKSREKHLPYLDIKRDPFVGMAF
jgi:hypothetical protein